MIKQNKILLNLLVVFLCTFFSAQASTLSLRLDSGSENLISVTGKVVNTKGEPIENATVYLNADLIEFPRSTKTDENGNYSFDQVQTGVNYELSVRKDEDRAYNVTSLDYVFIVRHMLGLDEHLDQPYKIIAADTNADNKLSALDLEHFRKVILGVILKFPQIETMRFANADYDFPDVQNPWPDDDDNPYIIKFKPSENVSYGFVGIQIGNVNQN